MPKISKIRKRTERREAALSLAKRLAALRQAGQANEDHIAFLSLPENVRSAEMMLRHRPDYPLDELCDLIYSVRVAVDGIRFED